MEMTTPSQGEWLTVGDRDVVASSTRALLMKGERKRKKKKVSFHSLSSRVGHNNMARAPGSNFVVMWNSTTPR